MNRWIIVFGAILIQLCLGAIYAWSVFTPPLVAPLPDDNFVDIETSNGIVVEIVGELVVSEDNSIQLIFRDDQNQTVTDFSNITVSLELHDTDNEIVVSNKYFPFTKKIIKDGSEVLAGSPYYPPLDEANNSYNFDTGRADNGKAHVNLGGNWHIIINAIRIDSDGNATLYYDYDINNQVKTGDFGFSRTETQIIFSIGLLTFAIFTIIGGRLTAKFGPRKIAIAGGIVLGSGYILGSFMGTSFPGLVFAIGILGGAGIGLAYVVPIGVGVKWFPDKKGMISGLAVAGFGFGAMLWMKLFTGLKFGKVINLTPGWDGLYATFTVSEIFLIYGISFFLAVLVGGLIMRNPPEGWKPKGWNPPEAKVNAATGSVEFTSAQMRKTPQYYMLFFMFMIGAGAGLMVIGVIKLFGIDAQLEGGATFDDADIIAGTAMALFFSLANGIGRIAWGIVSDKIGRKMSFVAMFSIQGLMMIAFFFLAGNEYLLYVGAAIIGFNFGGNFALFPAATADFFGNKTVGTNYGWVFFAYGIGGLIGPILGGVMGDLELWMWAFIPAGILLLACAGVAFMLKPPKAPEQIE